MSQKFHFNVFWCVCVCVDERHYSHFSLLYAYSNEESKRKSSSLLPLPLSTLSPFCWCLYVVRLSSFKIQLHHSPSKTITEKFASHSFSSFYFSLPLLSAPLSPVQFLSFVQSVPCCFEGSSHQMEKEIFIELTQTNRKREPHTCVCMCVCTCEKWKKRALFRPTCIYTFGSFLCCSVCMCMYRCVYDCTLLLCMCMWERERERMRDDGSLRCVCTHSGVYVVLCTIWVCIFIVSVHHVYAQLNFDKCIRTH